MSLNPDKNVRLYYSIKEVSEMLDVNITTLRFWEKEFPQLKPKVTAAKVRQYSEKDIALLRTIRSLVKVRGFKIAAARKYLMEDMHGAEDRAELLDTLISVRDQLKDLKARWASWSEWPRLVLLQGAVPRSLCLASWSKALA